MFRRRAREILAQEEGEMREVVMKNEIKGMEEMLQENYPIRIPVIHHLLIMEIAIFNFKQNNQSMNNHRGHDQVEERSTGK